VSIEGVERVAVVVVERQSPPDALGQVGVRDEIAPECNQIGVTLLDDRLGATGSKPPAAMILPLKIFRSCSDATGACPSPISTLPLTRGSMMWR
jgi:hypothetical protein